MVWFDLCLFGCYYVVLVFECGLKLCLVGLGWVIMVIDWWLFRVSCFRVAVFSDLLG